MVAFQHVAGPGLPRLPSRLSISISWSIHGQDSTHLVGRESSRPAAQQMGVRASRAHTLEVHHLKGLLGQQSSPRVWVDALLSTSKEEAEVSRDLFPGAGSSQIQSIDESIPKDVCQYLKDSGPPVSDVSVFPTTQEPGMSCFTQSQVIVYIPGTT